jgi:hypothetical protein
MGHTSRTTDARSGPRLRRANHVRDLSGGAHEYGSIRGIAGSKARRRRPRTTALGGPQHGRARSILMDAPSSSLRVRPRSSRMCAVARTNRRRSGLEPPSETWPVRMYSLAACAVLIAACQTEEARPQRHVALAQPEAAREPPAQQAAEVDAASPMPAALADDAGAPSQGETPSVGKPKRSAKAKVRTIHPLSPTRPDCLEMVSYCTGKPRRCTSAPVHVACGDEVEVASRKEWLRCVCP